MENKEDSEIDMETLIRLTSDLPPLNEKSSLKI